MRTRCGISQAGVDLFSSGQNIHLPADFPQSSWWSTPAVYLCLNTSLMWSSGLSHELFESIEGISQCSQSAVFEDSTVVKTDSSSLAEWCKCPDGPLWPSACFRTNLGICFGPAPCLYSIRTSHFRFLPCVQRSLSFPFRLQIAWPGSSWPCKAQSDLVVSGRSNSPEFWVQGGAAHWSFYKSVPHSAVGGGGLDCLCLLWARACGRSNCCEMLTAGVWLWAHSKMVIGCVLAYFCTYGSAGFLGHPGVDQSEATRYHSLLPVAMLLGCCGWRTI